MRKSQTVQDVSLEDDMEGDELLRAFVKQYKDGQAGCSMNADTAQSLALAVQAILPK